MFNNTGRKALFQKLMQHVCRYGTILLFALRRNKMKKIKVFHQQIFGEFDKRSKTFKEFMGSCIYSEQKLMNRFSERQNVPNTQIWKKCIKNECIENHTKCQIDSDFYCFLKYV